MAKVGAKPGQGQVIVGKNVLTGRQKAAIFLVTLGSEISSEIFKHLREDEIEQLTFEIARLETVDPGERDKVMMEFQELMMAQDFITSGGIDYARDLLERALGSQKAVDIINRLTSSLQVRPFDFIRRTDPSHLLNFIQGEHPQTIALILAYLEPNKSSVILGSLPDDIQADVAKRIATMDRTTPDVLREVERVLEKKLSTLASEDYTAAGGL
jgi:flagellar motor switch protein FliG